MIATGPINAATGIAIISAVPTLIAPAGARGRAGSVRRVLQKPAVAGGHGMLVMFDVTDPGKVARHDREGWYERNG